MSINPIKIVLVGDGAVGKISLVHYLVSKERLDKYIPVVFENFSYTLEVDGKKVDLSIWLNAGQEDYDQLRPLSYPDTEVFVICFSVIDETSLIHVQKKWIKEVHNHYEVCKPGCFKVLVGTKIDLRNDPQVISQGHRIMVPEDGHEMAKKLGCVTYLECSGHTGEGIENIFQEITRLYLKKGYRLSDEEMAYLDVQKTISFQSYKKWKHEKRYLIMGDEKSGKSSFMRAITQQKSISDTSTELKTSSRTGIFDVQIWSSKAELGGSSPDIHFWECPVDRKNIRKICYAFCDVVMILVPVDDPSALERVRKKWIPEVLRNVTGVIQKEENNDHQYVRFVPILIIGTKIDLRKEYEEKLEESEGEVESNSVEEKFITRQAGEKFVKDTSLYFETEKGSGKNHPTTLMTYMESSSKSMSFISLFWNTSFRKLLLGPFEGNRSMSKLRDNIKRYHVQNLKTIIKIRDLQKPSSPLTTPTKNIITKLRKEISKREEEEEERRKKKMQALLQDLKRELMILRIMVQNKMKETTSSTFFSVPLDKDRFFQAFLGFQNLRRSRLDILRKIFDTKKQQRWGYQDISDLQEQFSCRKYREILMNILFETPKDNNRRNIFSLEGLRSSIKTVQFFSLDQSREKEGKCMYFGECIFQPHQPTKEEEEEEEEGEVTGSGRWIPRGEGYIFRGYGSSGFTAKKKKKNYGLIFKGYFDDQGLKTKKGVELDLKTGKIIYEGQFLHGMRHGKGELYDLKKFECKKGVWNNGELVKEIGIFEFGMISYREIENQLLPKNEIGRGGNATVYDVMWKGTARAAKIISIPLGNNSLAYSVIVRSVRNNLSLLASLRHQNVIRLFGMIEGRRKVGYLMEKCVCDVNEVIVKEKLNFKEKIRILLETAQGMEYLHARDIMNRDLKWSNVLLNSSRKVCLTDLDTAREDETLWRNNVQNTSSSIGTPVFIAPELMSKKYDKRIDVYSFGIMIYSLIYELVNPYAETIECIGCKARIQSLNTYAFPNHVRDCNLRPMIDFHKQNSMKGDEKWIIDLMRVCWAKNPNRRPVFSEIVHLLRSKYNHLEDKIIRVSIHGSRTPHHEKFILMKKTYGSLFNKIQSRWPKSVIKRLSLVVSSSRSGEYFDIHEGVEDEELRRKIMGEEEPLIIVEFEEIPMEEELVSLEDLFSKLKEERKEKKEVKEENERLKERVIELEKEILRMKEIQRMELEKMKIENEF